MTAATLTRPALPGRLTIDARLVDEMRRVLGARVSDRVIVQYVRAALEDLRGSVSPEALPEMGARLAYYRLTTLLDGTDGHA